MNKEAIVQRIVDCGVVAVLRMSDSERLMHVIAAIREGGITALEITLTTPDALSLISRAVDEFDDDEEVIVGAGSVLDRAGARRAIDAGARYVVSPIFKREIVEEAHAHGLPAMPGAFTPTEIQTATERGADVVKVFPAEIVGMAFFKAVLAPMPHLRLMPTGGVSLTNAGDWIRSGACAVGVGSALLDPNAIAAKDWPTLTRNARLLRENVLAGRGAG